MIGLIGRMSAKVSDMSLAVRCAWLNGSLAVVLAACMGFAACGDDPLRQMAAVLVAAVICTLSANLALVLSLLWHGTPNGVNGALAGLLLGMFPPLAACMMFTLRGGPLTEAGVVYWILAFYLTALTVKTLLVAPTMSKPITATLKNSTSKNTVDRTDTSCNAGA